MSLRLHRVLRRVLPRAFRDHFGEEMEDAFAEALRAARAHGRLATTRLWLKEALDLLATGRALRREASRYGVRFVARGSAREEAHEMRNGGSGRSGRGRRSLGIVDDLRYAFRSLRRRPGFAAFAVMTVSLGIGASTAIFSTVEAVLINPLPYAAGERMVGVFRRMGPDARVFTTPTRAQREAWARRPDLFEALEGWGITYLSLSGSRDEPRQITAARVRPSFFDLLGREPFLGRSFDESELRGGGAHVAIASHAFWQNDLGGTRSAIGRTISLEGEPWTVIGVTEPGTLLPGWGLHHVDLWVPLAETVDAGSLTVTGVLAPGVDIDAVNSTLEAIGDGEGDTANDFGYASLVSEQVARGMRESLRLLMGAVLVLLLISCVNVANLLLFRGDTRQRETAVRSALGGGAGRLARQMLLESLLLAGGGGAVGVALAWVGQRAILAMRPPELEILDTVGLDRPVVAFAILVTVAAGLLFGSLPALQATRSDALDPLRRGNRGAAASAPRGRWVLIIGEVALSFALLLGSAAVLETLIDRQTGDVGFEAERVVFLDVTPPSWRFPTPVERAPLYADLERRLVRVPGVERVSHASGLPPRTGIMVGKLEAEGHEPSEAAEVLYGPSVGVGYFTTLGQRLVAGRTFTPDDMTSDETPIVLGEETARRLFPDRNPVGGRLRMGGEGSWMTVVGVVADVAMTGLNPNRAILQAYTPLEADRDEGGMVLRLAGETTAEAVLPLVRDAVHDIDAQLRVDVLAPATDLMSESLTNERFLTTLLTTFAGLALALATVGLYGVVSQVVGQRTREIGIRMALGARRRQVSGLVLRGAGLATGAGIGVGIVLAVAVSHLLDAGYFGLEANTPTTYLIAAATLGAAAILAASAPTLRAAAVDPVEAMRTE